MSYLRALSLLSLFSSVLLVPANAQQNASVAGPQTNAKPADDVPVTVTFTKPLPVKVVEMPSPPPGAPLCRSRLLPLLSAINQVEFVHRENLTRFNSKDKSG